MAGCSVQAQALYGPGSLRRGRRHLQPRNRAWPSATRTLDAADETRFSSDHDLVTAFETGWAALHQDVTLFVTDHLVRALADLRSIDAEIQRASTFCGASPMRQREAGTPWRARQALEVIALLDLAAWASLHGLLDECPVLPAALTSHP